MNLFKKLARLSGVLQAGHARPSPAAARAGLTASWSASMAMQASAPDELRGAIGRPSYLCARGPKAKFVADAGYSLQMGAP